MSDTRPFHSRVWRTPMRDLVRGRVTGRLDWRGQLARAVLPGEIKDVIGRVVDRTRLWKIEKAAVANELIAHFRDGLESGADAAALVRDFGDEKTAARLIRRAKRRGRGPVWLVCYWTVRGLFLVLGLYLMQLLPFVLLHPRVKVDYLAQLNGPLAGVPEGDRAWPLYRQAILGMGLAGKDDPLTQRVEPDDERLALLEVMPDSPAWPQLTAWLDTHAGDVELVRQASAKPSLGFVLGPGGSGDDPQFGWKSQNDPLPRLIYHSLLSVLLPDLNELRRLGQVLAADARYARTQRRGDRVAADLQAVLRLGGHRDSPLLISQLVGFGIYDFGFDEVEAALAAAPDLWSASQLADLARQVAAIGGDAPASLVDLSGEREVFYDVIQRLYSDDGHGNGRMTWEGAQSLSYLMGGNEAASRKPNLSVAVGATMFGVGPLVGSRKEVVDEFNRLMDLQAVRLQYPLRKTAPDHDPGEAFRQRVRAINDSVRLSTRYLPVAIMVPSMDHVAKRAELTLGRRDGVCVGLALEVYRRRHGSYPSTLDALVPEQLPAVPVDRITGGPLKYRIVDGRPVVYSVGIDRRDDGGRAATDPRHRDYPSRVNNRLAAGWWPEATSVDGDWIVFDGRPEAIAPAAGQPAS